MLPMAVELGLGAIWLGVYPLEGRILGGKRLLKLPEHVIPLAILPIGYPAESKEPIDRFNEQESIEINGKAYLSGAVTLREE